MPRTEGKREEQNRTERIKRQDFNKEHTREYQTSLALSVSPSVGPRTVAGGKRRRTGLGAWRGARAGEERDGVTLRGTP